jgi:hypothetical protein
VGIHQPDFFLTGASFDPRDITALKANLMDALHNAPICHSSSSGSARRSRAHCRAMTERSVVMKRVMTVLATTLLATSLFTAAAEARGGGGGGGHGGFGGGFGGGAHFGAFSGGEHLGAIGGRAFPNGLALHQHAIHRYGHFLPGYGLYGSYPDCYDYDYLHPTYPLPPACS